MNYGDTAECAVFGVLCLGQWATSASCYGAAGIVRRGAGCRVQGGVVRETGYRVQQRRVPCVQDFHTRSYYRC